MNYPVYDSFNTEYKIPFGAIPCKSECTFRLRFEKKLNVSEVALVLFRPGYKERYIPLVICRECDDYNEYYCTYSPQDLGVHQYYFTCTLDGNRRYIKRRGDSASEGIFDGNDLFQLTVYKEDASTPDWIKGGIMYQIFPDRFARGEMEEAEFPKDRTVHEKWDDTPDWRPDNQGKITNSDYFCGNLRGIISKLQYLQSLGISVIYLNPIFEAHENHRYNTACYEKIDPMLGTEEDFCELCARAQQRGIKIILDGVFSHTGADSVYFNKFGRYGENEGAYRNPDSKYRSWYNFVNYPTEYESWWGITTLPNVNENNEEYTKYICGENGILQKWIDKGAAGWRLDVADELPDEFIDNIHKAVKAKGDDKIVYGEVWEDASNKESYGIRRRYLVGDQLDSVMNYPFKECILNYVKYSDAKALVDGVMTIIEHYPKHCVDVLMNFLSTHDTERAISRLAGEEVGWHDREWQAERRLSDWQYAYGISMMKCAMVLQFFVPGIPCIYYGDEAGQEGYKDPFNRRTYPWGKENLELIDFTRTLSVIRNSTEAFKEGTIEFIHADRETVVFSRTDIYTTEKIVIFLNKSRTPRSYSIDEYGKEVKKVMRSAKTDYSKVYVNPFDFGAVIYTK